MSSIRSQSKFTETQNNFDRKMPMRRKNQKSAKGVASRQKFNSNKKTGVKHLTRATKCAAIRNSCNNAKKDCVASFYSSDNDIALRDKSNTICSNINKHKSNKSISYYANDLQHITENPSSGFISHIVFDAARNRYIKLNVENRNLSEFYKRTVNRTMLPNVWVTQTPINRDHRLFLDLDLGKCKSTIFQDEKKILKLINYCKQVANKLFHRSSHVFIQYNKKSNGVHLVFRDIIIKSNIYDCEISVAGGDTKKTFGNLTSRLIRKLFVNEIKDALHEDEEFKDIDFADIVDLSGGIRIPFCGKTNTVDGKVTIDASSRYICVTSEFKPVKGRNQAEIAYNQDIYNFKGTHEYPENTMDKLRDLYYQNQIRYTLDYSKNIYGKKFNLGTTEVPIAFNFDKKWIRIAFETIARKGWLNSFKSWWHYSCCMKSFCRSEDEKTIFKIWDRVCQKTAGYDKYNNEKMWKSMKMDMNTHTKFESILRQYFRYEIESPSFEHDLKHAKPSRMAYRLFDAAKKDIELLKVKKSQIKFRHISECSMIYDSFHQGEDIFIKSDTGTGKTWFLKKLLRKNKFKALSISPRQTFSQDFAKKLDFTSYLGTGKDRFKAERLIISLESLHRLERFDYDCIILDEVNAVLQQLSSPFISYSRNIDIFCSLIEKCKQVICLDANLDDRVINRITSHRNRSYKVFENVFKSRKNEVIELQNSKQELFLKVRDACVARKRFIVYTNSKKMSNIMKDYIESLNTSGKFSSDNTIFISPNYEQYHEGDRNARILLCNSETGNDTSDVNELWSKYDIIIYTSVIETGISFDKKNHFDCGFAYLTNLSTSVCSTLQMKDRVRHLADNKHYIYIDQVDAECKGIITSRKEIEKRLTTPTFKHYTKFLQADIEKERLTFKKTWFYNLVVDNIMIANWDRKEYFKYLVKHFKASGITMTLAKRASVEKMDPLLDSINEFISQLGRTRKDKDAHLISMAALPQDPDHCEGFHDSEKFNIWSTYHDFYGEECNDVEFIKKFGNSKVRHRFNNVCEYLQNKDRYIEHLKGKVNCDEICNTKIAKNYSRLISNQNKVVALELLEICQFMSLDDFGSIDADQLFEILKENIKRVQDLCSRYVRKSIFIDKSHHFKVAEKLIMKQNEYLACVMRVINSVLFDVFGVRIVKRKNRLEYYIKFNLPCRTEEQVNELRQKLIDRSGKFSAPISVSDKFDTSVLM